MGEGTANHNPFAPPSADADFAVRDQPYGYGHTHGYPLASYGARWGGAFIDSLLMMAVGLPFWLVGGFLVKGSTEEFGMAPMALGFLAILGFQAYQWYLVSTTGQTLGKRWLKMRIIRENGEPVNFVTGVVVRVWVLFAAQMIPLVGSFIGLADALAIFFGENRQTLHDRLAHTLVVRIDGVVG
jgi:uncharacterized RDD family membrane protein YckC